GGGGGGAEERRGLLAGPFEPLLDLIGGTGGDVLKFAGDALLACWPAEGHNAERALAGATASAAGCAEAMQAVLDRYAAAKRLPLALRIGIGAGGGVVLDVGGERETRERLGGASGGWARHRRPPPPCTGGPRPPRGPPPSRPGPPSRSRAPWSPP